MAPYLKKVAMLKKSILLVDGFAGPGTFEDGTSGSPLIMCEQAEHNVADNYVAVFVNKEKKHHNTLEQTLAEYIKKGAAFPILGKAQDLLKQIQSIAEDATLFVYIDPFGLKGCEFDTVASILGRGQSLSTEILVNISMPTLHRLSAHDAVAQGRGESQQVKWRHALLTRVLGGDYWKEPMLNNELSPSQKEELVMEQYLNKLRGLLPYAGSCPVRETKTSRVKYYVTFCSRHPDAMVLMNDIMLDAYNAYMYEREKESIPLFAETMPDWKDLHGKDVHLELKEKIDKLISSQPGFTRPRFWETIVNTDFMKYRRSELNKAIDELMDEGKVDSPTQRRTKRLNETCILIPKGSKNP